MNKIGSVKRNLRILALLLGASLAVPAWASPCDTFLCMVGKVEGQSGGDSCTSAISDFFAIQKFHNGHLDLGPTSDARRDYLQSCPGAQQNTHKVDSVINMFGNVE
jgi:hypothetical protein